MANVTRGFVTYVADSGGSVTIKCDNYTAATNGTTISKTPTQTNGWPFHKNDMRHVVGVDSAGRTTTCTILTPALYAAAVAGSTFTTHTGSYTVRSRSGERDNLRNMK